MSDNSILVTAKESAEEPLTASRWWPWPIIALTTVICGVSSVIYPFGIDQLHYGFMGDAILHGKILYRDIPLMQMPLTGVVHLIAMVLFGRNMAAIRILDILWTMGIAFLIYSFVLAGFRRRWLAITAGVLYPLLYFLYNWWYSAQPDGFLNLPIAAAFLVGLLALRKERAPVPRAPAKPSAISPSLLWLAAGVLVGIALLFKYPIGFALPCLGLGLLLAEGWHSGKAWRHAALLAAGCIIVVIGFVLALTISGGLPEFIRVQRGLLPAYSQAGSSALPPLPRLLLMFQNFARIADYQLILWLGVIGFAAGIGVLFSLGPGRPRQALGMTFLWLLAALISIFGQGKLIYYHYLAALPAVAILAAVALAEVFRPLAQLLRPSRTRLVVFAAAFAGVLLLTVYHDRLADLEQVASGRLKLRDYWTSDRFPAGDFSVAEELEMSEYIRDNTEPTDRVANFALLPQMSFPIWRDPVLRFSTVVNQDPSSWRLHPEFIANPPELFVVKHNDRIPWVRGHNMDSYEQLMAFTELRDYILAHYELEVRIRNSDVLRRADSDHELPSAVPGPEMLDADLREALQFISQLDSSDYRTVLWPVAVPSAPPSSADPRMWGVYSKLISQRSYNQSVWLGKTSFAERLPILSVWIEGDDRPLSVQFPFASQSEGRNIINGPYRFTLLHSCERGVVQVFLIDNVPQPKQ